MAIYGLELSGEITPKKVLGAVTECFVQAHKEVLDEMKEYHEFKSDEEFEQMKQMDVQMIIKSIFKDLGADFDNPTKADLLKAVEKLAEYAVNFRKPEIVKKHYDEITMLMSKLN